MPTDQTQGSVLDPDQIEWTQSGPTDFSILNTLLKTDLDLKQRVGTTREEHDV